MKSHYGKAAFLLAASALFIAGCATTEPAQQTAEKKVSCTGVAPATGTLLVRREDCSAKSAMTDDEKRQVQDEMNRAAAVRVNSGRNTP